NAIYALIDDVEPLQKALDTYPTAYEKHHQNMMMNKLGLNTFDPKTDNDLITDLFATLHVAETDMTLFYRNLANVDAESQTKQTDDDLLAPLLDAYYAPNELTPDHKTQIATWIRTYIKRIQKEGTPNETRKTNMNATNPKYVLRNYLAQLAIDKAEAGDHTGVQELLDVLRNPYDEQPGKETYAQKRPEWARHRAGCSMLSCSS
ncbi:MAG: protein adenylyltransferase SelO family protein, partial [Candidatus Latescibacterota bacterium]